MDCPYKVTKMVGDSGLDWCEFEEVLVESECDECEVPEKEE